MQSSFLSSFAFSKPLFVVAVQFSSLHSGFKDHDTDQRNLHTLSHFQHSLLSFVSCYYLTQSQHFLVHFGTKYSHYCFAKKIDQCVQRKRACIFDNYLDETVEIVPSTFDVFFVLQVTESLLYDSFRFSFLAVLFKNVLNTLQHYFAFFLVCHDSSKQQKVNNREVIAAQVFLQLIKFLFIKEISPQLHHYLSTQLFVHNFVFIQHQLLKFYFSSHIFQLNLAFSIEAVILSIISVEIVFQKCTGAQNEQTSLRKIMALLTQLFQTSMDVVFDVGVIYALLFSSGKGRKSSDFFDLLRSKYRLAFVVIKQIHLNFSMVFEYCEHFFFLFRLALLENLQ